MTPVLKCAAKLGCVYCKTEGRLSCGANVDERILCDGGHYALCPDRMGYDSEGVKIRALKCVDIQQVNNSVYPVSVLNNSHDKLTHSGSLMHQ